MSFAQTSPGLSGMPLGSLDAAVFDTETTGLNIRKARIIEIAGIKIKAGSIAADSEFARLVDPGIPIPDASTRIHGITDEMVSGSEDFRRAVLAFADWTGSGLLLGYSLDFDIAVLELEHERAGLLWSAPEALDVQELAEALRPDIPNWTMEEVAKWLSIDVGNRHRALADAKLTAEIFIRLIPRLKDAGIATAGHALRVCEANRKSQEGVRSRPRRQAAPVGIDDSPYRRRIKDVMSSPPAVVDPDCRLDAAVRLMVDDGITSLFVRGLDDEQLGIMTESDVLRALSQMGPSALTEQVRHVSSSPLQSVDAKEFLYRAIVLMRSGGIRHLGVVDADGGLVGAVTSKDVLSGHGTDAVCLGDDILSASNSAELGRVWSELGQVVRSLTTQSVEPRIIAALVSRELRALTEKSCEIALAEIEDRLGAPPSSFAVMVLGSGGRGESLLAMDQDNAVVFEGNDDSQVEWFTAFGDVMASILHDAGVKLCSGGIMASNPEWCGTRDTWIDRVREWTSRTRPEDLLNVDIFFDAMPAFGDAGIVGRLRRQALEIARSNRPFLALLAKRAADVKDPFGILGRWKLDRNNRIDLKLHGLMPLFSAARVLSLMHGIESRSTAGRLRSLAASGACGEPLAEDLVIAHGVLLGCILQQQLRDGDSGMSLSNHVAPSEMSNLERQELRWAFHQVPRVSDLLNVPAFI